MRIQVADLGRAVEYLPANDAHMLTDTTYAHANPHRPIASEKCRFLLLVNVRDGSRASNAKQQMSCANK